MSQNDGLNRRSFLRNAGLTALVGAVAPGSSLAAAAGAALAPAALMRHRRRDSGDGAA